MIPTEPEAWILYYRQLNARFAYHLSWRWNVGEEPHGIHPPEMMPILAHLNRIDVYNNPVGHHREQQQLPLPLPTTKRGNRTSPGLPNWESQIVGRHCIDQPNPVGRKVETVSVLTHGCGGDTKDDWLATQVPNVDLVVHCGDESTHGNAWMNEPEARIFFDWFSGLDIAVFARR